MGNPHQHPQGQPPRRAHLGITDQVREKAWLQLVTTSLFGQYSLRLREYLL